MHFIPFVFFPLNAMTERDNMASLSVEKGGVRDTKIETITSFVMRECGGDRELAVFMNAMQVTTGAIAISWV